MAEGPVNFGKPLLILVIAGCVGGGYWAYKNWPSHYEGNGWGVDYPNKWEFTPSTDPATPGKVLANGALKLEEHGNGVGWIMLHYHGALNFQPLNLVLGYHLPCHLRALEVGSPGEDLLRLIKGVDVRRIERGCSGMAGMWGNSLTTVA